MHSWMNKCNKFWKLRFNFHFKTFFINRNFFISILWKYTNNANNNVGLSMHIYTYKTWPLSSLLYTKNATSLEIFKSQIKTYLYRRSYDSHWFHWTHERSLFLRPRLCYGTIHIILLLLFNLLGNWFQSMKESAENNLRPSEQNHEKYGLSNIPIWPGGTYFL